MHLLLAALALFIQDSTPNQRLAALGEEVFLHSLEDNGLARLRFGLTVEKLPDVSEAAARADAAFWRSVSRRVALISERGLDHEEVLSKAILTWQTTRA